MSQGTQEERMESENSVIESQRGNDRDEASSSRTLSIAVAILFIHGAPIFGQAKDLPAVHPPEFSFFAGQAFKVEMTADRTEVHVEEPLELTVRITAIGKWTHAPRGKGDKKIKLFPPEFLDDDVYLELKDEKAEKNAWVFIYRLKPKHRRLAAIPGVQLMFYDPGTKEFPVTARTDDIPVKILAREKTDTPDEVARALVAPPDYYEVNGGPEVLARPEAELWSQPFVLALLFFAPPLACAAWYVIWRRRNPDALLAARRRKSAAARLALQALQDGEASPGQLASTVTEFLRKRFDLPGAEPTPAEVDRVLFRWGVTRKLREQTVAFLQSCDAGRFGAAAVTDSRRLCDEAAALINALEAEPCVQRAS
jgi:hypothetical protein